MEYVLASLAAVITLALLIGLWLGMVHLYMHLEDRIPDLGAWMGAALVGLAILVILEEAARMIILSKLVEGL